MNFRIGESEIAVEIHEIQDDRVRGCAKCSRLAPFLKKALPKRTALAPGR